MKDINEVIRRKEAELQQAQREMDALRIAARLLSEGTETSPAYTPRPSTPTYAAPGRRASAPGAGEVDYGASWDAVANKFP